MNRARHLLQSSLIVILFFALDKIGGLARLLLVSNAFGTGREYDAFTAANQLPEVFVTLVSGGALAAAFIPVYSAYLTGERAKQSARLANTTLTLVLLILTTISAAGALLAPWLVRVWLVPDFPPDLQQLTAELMRIILIQTTIFGVSGVLSSILNAHQHFALPALAPLALHIGYVIGLYLFVPRLGIHGLAWGTVVGGLLHILIQVPALLRHRFRYQPALDLHLSGTRQILHLMWPRIFTLSAIQVADLFIIRLTSGLSEGSTSAYFYGYYLMQLPETLLGTAIAIVVFPTLAEYYNAGNLTALKETAMGALRVIWMLTIPAAVGLVLLGREAITLVLQRGAFDAESTRLVYTVLLFFSIRIVSEATLEIVARLFYARHNTRTPMFLYLGWLVINVAFAALLVGPLGIGGIALASTIAFTALSAALFILNRRELGSLGERQLAFSAGRSLLAAGGMALAITGVRLLLGNSLLFLIVGGGLGTAIYLLLHYLLGGPELRALWGMVRPGRERALAA
jgi:putative peptidoglycan lipid II flippase